MSDAEHSENDETSNGPENPDAAEAIARALSRLRGRGPRRSGPHPTLAADSLRGVWAGHGGRGGQRRGRGPGDGPGDGVGMIHRGALGGHGGRHGGMAMMRMLEALEYADEPLSVSAIGEAVGVDQPRASRLVQQAAERGLVLREADPDDARRTRIALSDDGRSFVRRMTQERRESLGAALTALTPDEQTQLARLLTKLADHW